MREKFRKFNISVEDQINLSLQRHQIILNMDLSPPTMEDYIYQSYSVLKPKQYINGNSNAVGFLEDPKRLNKEIRKGKTARGLSMLSQFAEKFCKDKTGFSIKDPRSDYSLNIAGPND